MTGVRKRLKHTLAGARQNVWKYFGKQSVKWRKLFVWVITVHSENNLRVFEFDTEKEARGAFHEIPGYKILTEVIYFNDYCLVEA